MAGDWIKIAEDLHEKPEVLKMAETLKTRPEHVAGYCVKFWAWVSRQTGDGVVHGVTLDGLESVLGLPHFLAMMRQVGWLEYIEDPTGPTIIIPKFDRHLSESAKKRATAAEKKRQQRSKSVPILSPQNRDTCPPQTGTREEKSREEKSIKKKVNQRKTFVIPTLDDVTAYTQERKSAVNPERFLDYYTSNGWRVGKNAMKDWKAAVRTWERNSNGYPAGSEAAEADLAAKDKQARKERHRKRLADRGIT